MAKFAHPAPVLTQDPVIATDTIPPITEASSPTTASTAPPVEKVVKNRIIPASEAEQQAQRLRELRALPKPPGKNVPFDVMQQWNATLNTQQKERLSIYVYRHWPELRIEQVDPNRDKYIDCLPEIPTREYMIDVHGGGKYGFIVKDIDAGGTYFESYLEVPYPTYEPKFDIRATDWNSKRNLSWIGKLRAEGRIDSSNNIVEKKDAPLSQPQATSIDPVALLDKVMGIVKDSTKDQIQDLRQRVTSKDNDSGGISQTIANIMIENMKQNDPTKLLQIAQAIIPKTTNDGGISTVLPLMIKMMEMQSTQAQSQMTMLLEVMKQNNTNASSGTKDPLAFAERMMDFAEKRLGKHNPVEETTTDKIIAAAERIGLPLFEVVTNAFMARSAAQAGQQYQPPKPVTNIPAIASGGVAFDPYANPDMLRQHTAQQASNEARPTPGIPTVEGVNSELVMLFRKFTPMLINVISSGKDGATFGEDLEAMLGIQAVSSIIAKGSKELLSAASSVPELWNTVAPTPERASMMEEWIDEFVNYKQILASEAIKNENDERVQ